MAARSWIILFDTTGVQQAYFDNPVSVDIVHEVNKYSELTATFNGNDTRVLLANIDFFVELWRSIDNAPAYIEFEGFWRGSKDELTAQGEHLYTWYARGYLDLLHRRHILYQDVTPYTLKQDSGESVIKQFVDENAGPGANNLLRDTPGSFPGLTIDTDQKNGALWTDQTHRENLLDLIASIGKLTLIDFTIKRTSGTASFTFFTYWPQIGTDRRALLIFAPDLGNAIVPVYTSDARSEANVVIVLGPGSGSSQRIVVSKGTDVAASPWSTVETTTSATGHDDFAAMVDAGATAIVAGLPIQLLEFDVVQTDVAKYGRDYVVGDVVTARFGTVSQPLKITGGTLSIKAGKETIKLNVENAPIVNPPVPAQPTIAIAAVQALALAVIIPYEVGALVSGVYNTNGKVLGTDYAVIIGDDAMSNMYITIHKGAIVPFFYNWYAADTGFSDVPAQTRIPALPFPPGSVGWVPEPPNTNINEYSPNTATTTAQITSDAAAAHLTAGGFAFWFQTSLALTPLNFQYSIPFAAVGIVEGQDYENNSSTFAANVATNTFILQGVNPLCKIGVRLSLNPSKGTVDQCIQALNAYMSEGFPLDIIVIEVLAGQADLFTQFLSQLRPNL